MSTCLTPSRGCLPSMSYASRHRLDCNRQVSSDPECPDWVFDGLWQDSRTKTLPYTVQDVYHRDHTPTDVEVIKMSNDHVEATITPGWGGRLWSLYNKHTGKPLFYDSDVFQPTNDALRQAYIEGGSEWNFGPQIGHMSNTLEDACVLLQSRLTSKFCLSECTGAVRCAFMHETHRVARLMSVLQVRCAVADGAGRCDSGVDARTRLGVCLASRHVRWEWLCPLRAPQAHQPDQRHSTRLLVDKRGDQRGQRWVGCRPDPHSCHPLDLRQHNSSSTTLAFLPRAKPWARCLESHGIQRRLDVPQLSRIDCGGKQALCCSRRSFVRTPSVPSFTPFRRTSIHAMYRRIFLPG